LTKHCRYLIRFYLFHISHTQSYFSTVISTQQMSLNELVNIYNQKLNTNGGGNSTFATNYSQETQFNSYSQGYNPSHSQQYHDGVTTALLFDGDTTRFQLNDRVLAGENVRPPPHNQPRIERIKQADKVVFSEENDIHDYEHNEEYNTKYPDIKPQLNIINARQIQIPPADMFTNPGEQVQRLIHQGKLKNLHGYINYPYNYIEPPWYYSNLEEQQGYVNLNPPPTHLTAADLQNNVDDSHDINLPAGVPQEVVSQDRYEFIPLPKMVYDNFVPLIASRKISYRNQHSARVSSENRSLFASNLPDVNETTFQF